MCRYFSRNRAYFIHRQLDGRPVGARRRCLERIIDLLHCWLCEGPFVVNSERPYSGKLDLLRNSHFKGLGFRSILIHLSYCVVDCQIEGLFSFFDEIKHVFEHLLTADLDVIEAQSVVLEA